MKRFFAIILLINLLKVGAQDVDSLILLSLKLDSDTEKVNLFYREGFAFRNSDPQYSFTCARQAEKFATLSAHPYYLAKSFNLLGILFYRKNDLLNALAYHKKARDLRITINDKKGLAASETNLGNVYVEMKKYALAENAYTRALKLNYEINDQKQVGNCLLNLGVLMADYGRKDAAMIGAAREFFLKAIANAKARYDYDLEAMCLNNLAVVNISLHQFDDAIANCLNSIKIKDMTENDMEKTDSYLNMSSAFFKKGNVPEGLRCLEVADSLIEKFNYLAARIQALKIRSDYFKEQKNYEKAYFYFTRHEWLKDSLEKINDQIKQDYYFSEPTVVVTNQKKYKFPYIYLNLLLINCILIAWFILKLKR